jgi:hypothetical protein
MPSSANGSAIRPARRTGHDREQPAVLDRAAAARLNALRKQGRGNRARGPDPAATRTWPAPWPRMPRILDHAARAGHEPVTKPR